MRSLIVGLIVAGSLFAQGRPMPGPFATAGSTAGGTCGVLGGDLSGTCAAAVVGSINAKAISLAGPFTTVGAFNATITLTADSNATLPAGTKTLVATDVATLSSLASIGTVTTGVWHGTAVGPQWGGSGADLSATGGANQVVKQATTGSAFTVGTLASTQLSDQTDLVRGGANLTTTGAVPFQNGTTATLTQVSTFTYASKVLQIEALGAFRFATSCQMVDGTDGFLKLENSAGTGACEIIFGPGGGSANDPAIVPVIQANPYLLLRNAAGTGTANLRIEAQKSTTGQRFLCIDTNGQLVSSTTSCIGT